MIINYLPSSSPNATPNVLYAIEVPLPLLAFSVHQFDSSSSSKLGLPLQPMIPVLITSRMLMIITLLLHIIPLQPPRTMHDNRRRSPELHIDRIALDVAVAAVDVLVHAVLSAVVSFDARGRGRMSYSFSETASVDDVFFWAGEVVCFEAVVPGLDDGGYEEESGGLQEGGHFALFKDVKFDGS